MSTYNLHGDVSAEDRDLADELNELEAHFDDFGEIKLNNASVARAYVAMAHDWIGLGLEERAEQLFSKAEQVCPGYFKGPILDHAEEDSDFAQLIVNMESDLRALIITLLSSK